MLAELWREFTPAPHPQQSPVDYLSNMAGHKMADLLTVLADRSFADRVEGAVMDHELAVYIVAAHAIYQASREIEWSSYPEIGEDDWHRVVEAIERKVGGPQSAFYEAYEILEGRAK